MSQLQNRSAVSLLGAPQNVSSVFSMLNAFKSDNIAITVIALNDVWQNITLGSGFLTGQGATADWSVSSSTLGEVTYDGVPPFTGIVIVGLSIMTSLATPWQAGLRIVKNGVQVGGFIEHQVDDSNVARGVMVAASVSLVTDDTIRVQIKNITNTNNAVVKSIQMKID